MKMKMKVKIKVKMKMKVKMNVKMRIGTHRCPRCCRRLLLPSLLWSSLPSTSPLPPPFLLLPLFVNFCPSHHCRHHRPPSPSPPYLPLPHLVNCCILYLPSMPTAIVVIVARHRHHCRRRQSKPITKKRAPRATRTPPSRPRLSRPTRKDVWRPSPATAQGSHPRRQYRQKQSMDSGPLPPTPASTRRRLGAPPLPTLTRQRQ